MAGRKPKLASVIGVVQKAFMALNATMLANPIVLIIAAIAALVAAFIYLWNTNEEFRQFWIDLWESIKEIAVAVWEGIKAIFQAVVEAIKLIITTYFNIYKTIIMTVLNAIKTAVGNGFNAMLNGIKSVVGKIASTIRDGFNAAVDFIKGLISSAFNWGKDLIMGIVDGIWSCISAVGDAVGAVADKIKSFLHFSVPDEGPLTDYESWMPDFMKGLAQGIEESRGLIENAMGDVASDMIISPKVTPALAGASGAIINAGVSGQSMVSAIREAVQGLSGQGGDIVIPVYLGGTLLDEVIVNAQQSMNLRSGGR